MLTHRWALLLDGSFVIRKLRNLLGRHPEADDVIRLIDALRHHPELHGGYLLRAYFYDAPPADGTLPGVLGGDSLDLSTTDVKKRRESLLTRLEHARDVAVRLGQTAVRGWRLRQGVLKGMRKDPRPLGPDDLYPAIEQKGVDLRIGLDIARLSLQHLVDIVVVVTADSDFVPAFKFARREGLRVYLAPLGHGVRSELKVHADVVLDLDMAGDVVAGGRAGSRGARRPARAGPVPQVRRSARVAARSMGHVPRVRELPGVPVHA